MMKFKLIHLLLILCIVLLLLILFNLYRGCRKVEKFSEAKKISNSVKSSEPNGNEYYAGPEAAFSKSELKLLEDIKNNRLNDSTLNTLIDSGQITEKLIERFIEYIDSQPDKKEEPKTVGKKEDLSKEYKIESFCNDTMCAAF